MGSSALARKANRVDVKQDEIGPDMRAILERWGAWERAGGGIRRAIVGSYDERHDACQECYRDPVAELVDPCIAKLPTKLRKCIVHIWARQRTERQTAIVLHTNRGRVRFIHAVAIGRVAGKLEERIGRPPTILVLERWTGSRVQKTPNA